MKKIKKVSAYPTTDGKSFQLHINAVKHQAEVDFNDAVDNAEYNDTPLEVDQCEMHAFFAKNIDAIKSFIHYHHTAPRPKKPKTVGEKPETKAPGS